LYAPSASDGSFLADHLRVTRDRTVFAAIEFMMAFRCTMKIESVFYCLAPSPLLKRAIANISFSTTLSLPEFHHPEN